MSYLFQSRQLHPRYCGLGLGTIGRGMGLVGPDQPWTAANAGKPIAQATRECPAVNEKKVTNEWTRPKSVVGGNVVDDPDCFQTGKIIEAQKPGKARWVEWCCPVRTELPKRALAQQEYEEYKDRCQPKLHPNGTVYETFPAWRRPSQDYISGSCDRPGIFDEGYELVCCPAPQSFSKITLPETTFISQAIPTAEQEEEWEQQRQQRQIEQEQAAAAAAPPSSTFIERYGFAILLAAGTVGLGVTAALFKRFSVTTKKAEESKAAIAELKSKQEES